MARTCVAFVLPSFAAGGAERVFITLLNGLDPAQYDRHLIVINEDGALRPLVAEGITLHLLGKGTRVRHRIFSLFRTLKKLRPDICVSTMAHMNFAVLLMRPFFPGVKFIVREAITPSYFLGRGKIRSMIVIGAYRILYPMADVIISPAQAIIDEFSELVGMKKGQHVLLPNPVDSEKIRSRAIVPKSDGERLFICAGRLHHQKGYDRLFDKLVHMKGRDNWRLVVLGEGPEHAVLEKQIETLGLSGKVILKGFSDNPWAEIAGADAFLMPSRWEGLPNAVLEALACGTPVIATRESGGIEEIARYTGKGALTIVDTMDEFLAEMLKVSPSKIDAFRPSLLPEIFLKESVNSALAGILVQSCKKNQASLRRK